MFGIFLTFLLLFTNLKTLKTEIPKICSITSHRRESFNYENFYQKHKNNAGLFDAVYYLRHNSDKYDVILCDLDLYEPLGLLGAVPLFKPTGWEIALGVPESQIQERINLIEVPSSDIEPYFRQGARLIVAKKNGEMSKMLFDWEKKGKVKIQKNYGDFYIARIQLQ